MKTEYQPSAVPGEAAPRPPGEPEWLAALRPYIRPAAIGMGLLLAAAALGAVYFSQQRRNAQTAEGMLAVAQSPQQLEEILAQYPAAPAAAVALLKLAGEHYAAGAYDQAIRQYVRFAQQHPRHPLAPAAELGRVLCLEGRGEAEQALEGFAAFEQNHPGHYLLPQALLGHARCLRQTGHGDQARAIYEDFIVAHPDSPWKSDMENGLRRLDSDKRAPASAPAGIHFVQPAAVPAAPAP